MWFKRSKKSDRKKTPLLFYNTRGQEKQEFEPPELWKEVRMYNCGPTVYGLQHIGNLSMFVCTDVLRRALEYNHLTVKQVINFTDFGHLASDGDEGEDKMAKGLKREGLAPSLENMRALGEKYANIFLENIRSLNVPVDRITFPRASDFIPEQIAMIQTLAEKGYTYATKSGVYFDTSRFADYGKLGNINLEGLKEGARVKANADKRNPTDFLLWKSSKKIGWDSPWGKGFPGWHIECSAMIRATLGTQIDIHTGGIEHIPVHHNNEIAQSESATGKKPMSRFWLHRAHIQLEGAKIAKSDGNVVYLSDIIERGFHPLSLRYLFLGAHYRTPSNFTWEALGAAQTAFAKLVALRLSLGNVTPGKTPAAWKSKFVEKINDDLDTPGALAVIWEMTRDESLSPEERLSMLLDADKVLGLNLAEPDEKAQVLAANETKVELKIEDVPEHVQKLIEERIEARKSKNWERADELRTRIASEGYSIEDAGDSSRIFKL
ncbi:cysteine--tRNA ligase [Candidatus Kaiserbacteria bacterium CG10_big_fil_rev_8_21_14_0_10_51_14]|uniref:Cysteine--tRNA ligase n=1 Tax=Candidatus Kaiserbacteria bacterium CG10_big_fil_rev_8_21_14_0_10_51_14 TaxID=1974610 RepID=A0A2H0UEA3_9BACT|nr:MAG: cysteine--tRNA ligase [Candidatus Kaiserbacteria bacterium CG10_big_fil_rev_8_21_14_0_10_51_14]